MLINVSHALIKKRESCIYVVNDWLIPRKSYTAYIKDWKGKRANYALVANWAKTTHLNCDQTIDILISGQNSVTTNLNNTMLAMPTTNLNNNAMHATKSMN